MGLDPDRARLWERAGGLTPPDHRHVPAVSTQLDTIAAIDYSLLGPPTFTEEYGDIALKVMSSWESLEQIWEQGSLADPHTHLCVCAGGDLQGGHVPAETLSTACSAACGTTHGTARGFAHAPAHATAPGTRAHAAVGRHRARRQLSRLHLLHSRGPAQEHLQCHGRGGQRAELSPLGCPHAQPCSAPAP